MQLGRAQESEKPAQSGKNLPTINCYAFLCIVMPNNDLKCRKCNSYALVCIDFQNIALLCESMPYNAKAKAPLLFRLYDMNRSQ